MNNNGLCTPLRVAIRNDVLTIEIGERELAFAAESHPVLWQAKPKVTDASVFARAILARLLEEAEDGTTLVHKMLDDAIAAAIENGAEGVVTDG